MAKRDSSNDLPNGTPVVHAASGLRGATAWACIRNAYRVRWTDGTYTTTPRADLIVPASFSIHSER